MSTANTQERPRLYRLADLATSTGKAGLLPVSPATIWRWVREGRNGFPKPFKLGESITVWNGEAVDAWIAKRAGGVSQ
ncbi:helix-turn-helix transcriptional regulator [Variovorax sp. GB1P17]|uniref:helix-turn-helix transcriptional regulator n=1 Tax=Variovorax sp. GB1P17 TaxID=3443740 RepID=UPI003F44584E